MNYQTLTLVQKTKIMALGPRTSWQIDGETVETMTDFFLGGGGVGGSKITAAIIIRITRVGPVVTLNWNGDKSVGSSLGPRWVLPGISSPHFLYYYQYAKAGTKQIHAAQCQGPPHTHTSGVGIATSHYSLECLLEHLLVFSQSVARSRKCNGNWHKEGKGFVGLCAWKV